MDADLIDALLDAKFEQIMGSIGGVNEDVAQRELDRARSVLESRLREADEIERVAREVSHHATSDSATAHYAYFDALTRLRALLNKRDASLTPPSISPGEPK